MRSIESYSIHHFHSNQCESKLLAPHEIAKVEHGASKESPAPTRCVFESASLKYLGFSL